jgi:uncharacterized protein (TIGR02246 family)
MTSKTTTAGSDADRQAVLDVLARLYQAWEAGDAETFVADYTEDASVIQPGVYEKDREEIRTNIAAAFAGPLNGSRVAARPVNVRFLTGDTAIVVSEDGIIFPGQDAVASERLVRDLGAGQARRRLAHRLLPQQPRQLGCRLRGTGRSLPRSRPAPGSERSGSATALARS